MKKLIVLLTLILSIIGSVAVFSQELEQTKFSVNGKFQTLSVEPQVLNNTLMVPMIDLVKIIGCEDNIVYSWNDETKTALIKTSYFGLLEVTEGKKVITFLKEYQESDTGNIEIRNLDHSDQYVVLDRIVLDSVPIIYNGKMTVPVSFLQSFYEDYVEFDWKKSTNTLDLHITFYQSRS